MSHRKTNRDHAKKKHHPLLDKEGFLWVQATKVTQKALSERFLTFPAVLFEKVLFELLSHLQKQ